MDQHGFEGLVGAICKGWVGVTGVVVKGRTFSGGAASWLSGGTTQMRLIAKGLSGTASLASTTFSHPVYGYVAGSYRTGSSVFKVKPTRHLLVSRLGFKKR